MKTIKLKRDQYLKGRMRRKGEIITVSDNFDGGKTVTKDVGKKNKTKHRKPKPIKKPIKKKPKKKPKKLKEKKHAKTK